MAVDNLVAVELDSHVRRLDMLLAQFISIDMAVEWLGELEQERSIYFIIALWRASLSSK